MPNVPEEIQDSIIETSKFFEFFEPDFYIDPTVLDSGIAQLNAIREVPSVTRKRNEIPGVSIPAQTDTTTPRCRKHGKFMVYDPNEDRMRCEADKCTNVATRNRTFRNTVGSELTDSPAVYRGAIKFVVDETGELFMYLPEVNAMISLLGLQEADGFADPESNRKQMNVMKFVTGILPEAERQTTLLQRHIRQEASTAKLMSLREERQNFGKRRRLNMDGTWDEERFKEQ
jgi:hypothetical protein